MKQMKAAQQGFTLIELMIVIAIVGILAAIALPAYQDYTVRARMSEPLAVLAEAKTTVTEYYVANGDMPTEAQSGIRTDISTDIVASLALSIVSSQPLLTVTVQGSALPSGTDSDFVLSGRVQSGTLLWKCKPATAGTAVPTKYLPANCRG